MKSTRSLFTAGIFNSDLVMDAAGSVIGICVVWALYRKEKDLSG